MKDIYMELLQKFDGQIPEDFDKEVYLKEIADKQPSYQWLE
jgi:hypothetical protein